AFPWDSSDPETFAAAHAAQRGAWKSTVLLSSERPRLYTILVSQNRLTDQLSALQSGGPSGAKVLEEWGFRDEDTNVQVDGQSLDAFRRSFASAASQNLGTRRSDHCMMTATRDGSPVEVRIVGIPTVFETASTTLSVDEARRVLSAFRASLKAAPFRQLDS